MSVPDFQTLMLPILKALADGQERTNKEVRELMVQTFQLTDEERSEAVQSGQNRLSNRVAWALNYLKQARILDRPRRGAYCINARGTEVLAEAPPRIDIRYLERFPEFVEFRSRNNADDEVAAMPAAAIGGAVVALTPDEQIRAGYRQLRASVAEQLLDRIRDASPAFFETLVVKLLVAMGYGGSQEDAAKVVGGTGDGGIDGIIKEDRLGLESIYVQAKRWQATSSVGRPDIQQFAGALQGHRARKGVFITTSRFTDEARQYAKGLQTTIVLIDAVELADLLIDYGVAVQGESLTLVRIDEDFFAED